MNARKTYFFFAFLREAMLHVRSRLLILTPHEALHPKLIVQDDAAIDFFRRVDAGDFRQIW